MHTRTYFRQNLDSFSRQNIPLRLFGVKRKIYNLHFQNNSSEHFQGFIINLYVTILEMLDKLKYSVAQLQFWALMIKLVC